MILLRDKDSGMSYAVPESEVEAFRARFSGMVIVDWPEGCRGWGIGVDPWPDRGPEQLELPL